MRPFALFAAVALALVAILPGCAVHTIDRRPVVYDTSPPPAPVPQPAPQPPAASVAAKAQKEPGSNALSLGFGASKSVASGISWAGDLRFAWEPTRFFRLSLAGAYGNALESTFAEYGLQIRAGFHLHPRAGPVTFLIGVDLGPGIYWQTVSGTDAGASLALVGGPRLGVRVDVAGPVFLCVEGEALGAVMQIDRETRAVFLPGGLFSVGLQL